MKILCYIQNNPPPWGVFALTTGGCLLIIIFMSLFSIPFIAGAYYPTQTNITIALADSGITEQFFITFFDVVDIWVKLVMGIILIFGIFWPIYHYYYKKKREDMPP